MNDSSGDLSGSTSHWGAEDLDSSEYLDSRDVLLSPREKNERGGIRPIKRCEVGGSLLKNAKKGNPRSQYIL